MKILKIIISVMVLPVLILSTTAVRANAAVTDEQRKEITDELFEINWNNDFKRYFWRQTRSKVPIRDNPLAATLYMRIEAQILVCDDDLLEQLYNGEIDTKQFYEQFDFDYEKAKKIDKYKNSLLQGYEFSYRDYKNGVWEMGLEENHETFYGYFREDAENFTLYDNDTNEVLGVYPRLLDFDYLDDDNDDGDGSGGNGGSNGGNSGGNSGGSNGGNNGNADKATENNESNNEDKTRSSSTNSESTSSFVPDVKKEDNGDITSRYDTDNPAVTPEIASAVDAMKSSSGSSPEDESYTANSYPEDKPVSSTNNSVIIIAVVVVICGAAFFLLKKKKDSNSQK